MLTKDEILLLINTSELMTLVLKKVLLLQDEEAKVSGKVEKPINSQFVDPNKIIGFINRKYNCNISKRTRLANVALARHISCYFIRKYSDLSLLEIAVLTGTTDHTTALHGISKVKKRIASDDSFKERISDLEIELTHTL